MGFFDKIKNKVAQATGPQEHQELSPQPSHDAASDEAPELDDDHDTVFDGGSGNLEEVDDWGGWDPHDWNTYWYRIKLIEQAGNEGGDDACDAKCREFGLRDAEHMRNVSETFYRHFGEQQAFTQACLNAQNQITREAMAGAASSNQAIFEPVEGISLEVFASTQARSAQTGGDTARWGELLASVGMDQAKWDRVSTEWNRRMSGQAGDMNATMALLTEYSKYFGQAGQGQYGAAAAANAGQAGVYGGGAVGAEPCTLERYAEIGGAQSAWAQQGRDVNAMLAQQFGMSALDWSNLSQYWSAKFTSDYTIAGRYGELLEHYTQQYLAAGGGGQDSDIDI